MNKILLFLLLVSALMADNSTIEFKTQKVIVFKDGYCLVIKKGVATTDENGDIFTYEVPSAAVLGSFWATAEEESIASLNAEWRETKTITEQEVACTQHIEILEANKGKNCKVTTHDKVTYAGVIHRVLVNKTIDNISTSRSDLRHLIAEGTTSTISSFSGSHFILRNEEEDVLLSVSQIRSLSIRDMKTTRSHQVEQKKRQKQLTFSFAKARQKRSITLMYFTPGMRWIPSYRISLDKDNMAQVSLQAEIINQNEDLLNVPIDIVVGVPNFRFRDTVSPLTLETTLRNVLPRQNRNRFSNAIMTQQRNSYAAPVVNQRDSALPSELTASGSQDLFVYKLPKIKIRKGGRTAIHIFTAKVKYRDIYVWKAHIKRNLTYSSQKNENLPLEFSENKIWHQIELVNDTQLPWTTGAAMIMQGQQPLAQELLTYTSAGSKVRVPVTVAIDISGTIDEKESSRSLKNIKWDGYYYAKIMNKAKLDICNNKRTAVDMEVVLTFGGKAIDVSDNGKVQLASYNNNDWNNYRGSSAVNNRSIITWKQKIEPGKNFLPSISYFYYIRH